MNREHNYLMLQEGIQPPVKTPDQTDQQYIRTFAAWHHDLNPKRQTLYEIQRGQVFGLLGVTSAEQIQPVIDTPDLRRQTSDRVLNQLGLVYGIRGLERIRQKFEDYGKHADSVIDYLQNTLSYPGCVNLEMVNEVRAYDDPTDLVLLSLDGRWSGKARYEAKRKLQLQILAASIDRREREIGIEGQFKKFVNWLHERIWSPDLLLGQSRGSFLISTHDPQTWACTAIKLLGEDDGAGYELLHLQKKTHLPQRSFKTETGREIPLYVTIRGKSMEAKMLKMLRKGVEDPAIAVDDDTGLLVVVNNYKDARAFIGHLIRTGYQSNYPIVIEDVSYTLDGGEYQGKGASSRRLRMMKFFVRLANEMRIECIIHTPTTYAEHLYMRDVSHDEYELCRLFDSEVDVPRLLFRERYFPYFKMDQARQEGQRRIRADIEGIQTTA